MEIVNLSEENLYIYENYLDPDHAENIGREFYRGMVACEGDEPKAAVIWELINLYDNQNPTISRLDWMKADDPTAGSFILESYEFSIMQDEAEESRFEFDFNLARECVPMLVKAGFEAREAQGRRIDMRLGDFKNLKLAKVLGTPPYIKSLEDLKSRVFRRGMADCIYNINRQIPGDMIRLPMEWFETGLSCYEETDEECNGFLLIHECTSGVLRIELLADWGTEPEINLLYMIKFSLKRAFEKYPEDTGVTVFLRDSASEKLVSYLFPKIKRVKSVEGSRSEPCLSE